MTVPAQAEINTLLQNVQQWPPQVQREVAQKILQALPVETTLPRGVSAAEVRGLARGQGSPPDGETVQQWIQDQRTRKYG